MTECEVVRSHIGVDRGISKVIEGISGVSSDIVVGRKVVGMLYEPIAGCSTCFGAYYVMWTYQRAKHKQRAVVQIRRFGDGKSSKIGIFVFEYATTRHLS